MAIIPSQGLQKVFRQAVTLEEYAAFIEYDECSFFGVRGPNYQANQCREIWTLQQRNNIARYLAEAQEEIEDEVKFFLQPTWVIGQRNDAIEERFVDSRFPKRVHNTRWNKLIDVGEKGESNIELGATVDNSSDPAIVGPIATTVTDIYEVHIFHPGTDVEINPSDITISGGFVTITIPRCRLVATASQDNPESGLDYSDLSNFESTVDVKRIYHDSNGEQAILECSGYCDCGCTITSQSQCLRILNYRFGTVEVNNIHYNCCDRCCHKTVVGLYYYCGEQKLPLKGKESIIRLAHSKLPEEPCGCDVVHRMWERDRNIPDVMTRERAHCPFGINDGAWVAWKWAQTMKHFTMGSI